MTVESEPHTSESSKEKPFPEILLETPVSGLIAPPANWKTRPWDINLLDMLKEFRDRIILSNQVNLNLAGRVVSVASHIHRKRAEYILQEEKKRVLKKKRAAERKPRKEKIEEFELPSAPRLISRRVNTLELLSALARAVQIVKKKTTRSNNAHQKNSFPLEEDLLTLLPDELVRELELGSEGIEAFISKVYTTILQQVEGSNSGSIGLFSLVQEILTDEIGTYNFVSKKVKDHLTRLYIVRVVLCLLYLILRNKITVDQTEFFTDLQIQPLTSLPSEDS